jgi:hypothetical protein
MFFKLNTIMAAFLLLTTANALQGMSYQFVDLTPNASRYSVGASIGISDGRQVCNYQGHPCLWSGSAQSLVEIPVPSNIWYPYVTDIDGDLMVGCGSRTDYIEEDSINTALFGYGNLCNDIHPGGIYVQSNAWAIGDGQKVGMGKTSGELDFHALLWKLDGSVVDLHPTEGYLDTGAMDVSNGVQVGYGRINPDSNHALLWTGSAESLVDLNPVGCSDSVACGVSGEQQVGQGYFSGNRHALLWGGSAESTIDLNPEGFTCSTALGINDGLQVGWGRSTATNNNEHALLWSGSSESVVDLHQYVPVEFINSSAYGIDGQGNIVGFAVNAENIKHLVYWASIPEPGVLTMLISAALSLLGGVALTDVYHWVRKGHS